MKIVIFSAYYWPETAGTAPYVTMPAEFLAGRGHEVHVAAGFPHYPQWKPLAKRRLSVVEEYGGVTIHRRPHTVPSKQDARSRAFYEASMLAAGSLNLATLPRPDVYIGVIPALSSGILAALASKIFRRPFGLIIHDLMGRGAQQTGIGGGGVAGALESVESRVARRASRLLVLTEGFRDFFVENGFAPSGVDVAPPWTPRSLDHIDPVAARRRLGWPDGDFVCVHAGNMGRKQGLSNLVDAARLLQLEGERGIKIILLGDGSERSGLESRAREYGLENFEFSGTASNERYDDTLVAADALLLNQLPSVADMSMPSKLSAYLAAGRPVVGAVDAASVAAAVLRAADAGPIVDPSDPRAMASALAALRNETSAVVASMGEHARAYSKSDLSAAAILPRYERFAEQIRSRQ